MTTDVHGSELDLEMAFQTEKSLSQVRAFVIDRDNSCCRVCGRYVETPALHHILYRSQGGLDIPTNLCVVGWLPGHDCHLTVAHANKKLWQPILQEVVHTPGATAFQIKRWKDGVRPASPPMRTPASSWGPN